MSPLFSTIEAVVKLLALSIFFISVFIAFSLRFPL
jgi:hypothetical protein